jgi:hypothetical protein
MLLKLSLLLTLIAQGVYAKSSEEYIQLFMGQDQPDLIKIDFLVIQNLTIEEVDLKEKWRNLEEFSFSEELIQLKEEPTTLVTLVENDINDFALPDIQIKSLTNSDISNVEKSELKTPQPFLFERIPFQKRMIDIEANLNRSRDYRVVYYNSWYQPAVSKEISMPIFIEAIKKDKKIYGEINVYRERFIHLDSRIRFSQVTERIDPGDKKPNLVDFQKLLKKQKQNKDDSEATDNYWMDTIFNTVKVNFQYLENFISLDSLDIAPVIPAERIYKYQDLYEIDKEVKLEPEIFNYVDHPYFSILIRVKEISN